MHNLVTRLLRKNTSPARIAGFVLSNFIGLAIIMGGLQFYLDARSLWDSDDSFIKSDYLVVNKRVTSATTWGETAPSFTSQDIADLRRQPWVRDVGEFSSTDYRVWASVGQGGRGMSTMMFFESVPDAFVDGAGSDWGFREGENDVPVIISKDYLALYNFGFAGSAGLPQVSESIMSAIPLRLTLSSFDGDRVVEMQGHIAGFSNRLNTILVPQSFMDWSNRRLGGGDTAKSPSRLIVDVSSPGDVAIKEYLEGHGLEVAGDKSASSASYLLKVAAGIVVSVGLVITVLSFFILLLSMSLLMEKNRDKLHTLLMLGYEPRDVGAPYVRIVAWASVGAWVLAVAGCLLLRSGYVRVFEGLGVPSGPLWAAPLAGLALTLLLVAFNVRGVRRNVMSSWR